MSVSVLPSITMRPLACGPVFDALRTYLVCSAVNMLLLMLWHRFLYLGANVVVVNVCGLFFRFDEMRMQIAGALLFLVLLAKLPAGGSLIVVKVLRK